MFRTEGDADAASDVDRGVGDAERPIEGRQQRARHLLGTHGAGTVQEYGEFVAAQARDGVLSLEHIAEARADLLQEQVAILMAEGVVNFLEPVEVDHQQGN